MVNFSTRLLLCQIIQNGQTKYCIMPEMKVSYVFNLIIFSENPPKSNGRNEDSSDLLKNSSPGIYKALVSKVCNNISLFVLYIIERMPLDLPWILKTHANSISKLITPSYTADISHRNTHYLGTKSGWVESFDKSFYNLHSQLWIDITIFVTYWSGGLFPSYMFNDIINGIVSHPMCKHPTHGQWLQSIWSVI